MIYHITGGEIRHILEALELATMELEGGDIVDTTGATGMIEESQEILKSLLKSGSTKVTE